MTSYEDGNPEARILLLGEAPSYMEIRQGKPFVGPSGQVLEQCLHAAGIVRRECYILNLFEYEVKKTKSGILSNEYGDVLWTPKDGLSDLGEEEAKNCFDKIRASKANVVVPLGATALNAVTGLAKILKYRGSPLWSDRLGKKCIPTIHPAASLRGNYLWKHYITSDLAKVREARQSKKLDIPNRVINIHPGFQEVLDYLDALTGTSAFDIEVVNHQCYSISFTKTPFDAIVIRFVDDDGSPYWLLEEETAIWTAIATTLGRTDLLKVAQNTFFDISFLLRQNKILCKPPLADTMIAHHIIWPDLPKGLDFQVSVHTNEPYYKDEGKQWNKVQDPPTFLTYNGKDSCTTHEIWDALQIKLDAGFRQTYDETIEMLEPFLFMSERGIKIDKEALEKTSKDIAKEIERVEEALSEASDYDFNVQSPKQCQEYFYTHKGIKPYISRATGRPTTDDKAMSRIWRKHHLQEAKCVQELRGLKKLKSTYLDVGIDKDDRIRCSYNLRGTVTGRPSSSATIFGTGMNLQNLHPQFKEFLIAD